MALISMPQIFHELNMMQTQDKMQDYPPPIFNHVCHLFTSSKAHVRICSMSLIAALSKISLNYFT